jgi:23S rRNA (adenine2503-C2)-methyltransferase
MSWIYEFTLNDLISELRLFNIKDYVANQIFQWVYQKGIRDIDLWTNLSKVNRDFLKGKYEVHLNPVIESREDGLGTKKFLIQLQDQQRIETVLIKEKKHYTFCLSTQVGCPLKCKFCATGQMGFKRNLSMGEILSQLLLLKGEIARHKGKINLVFMGMGEPLLNYKNLEKALLIITSEKGMGISPKNITVSTAGILKEIKKFEKNFPNIKLSFSLNAPNSSLREELMPVSKREKLKEILEYFRTTTRKYRITFEYILFEGINDSLDDANKITTLLQGIPCKINVIPYNRIKGIPFKAPQKSTIEMFNEMLCDKGFTAIVRWSKGSEIDSACGQLSTAIDTDK